ncbi:MAG: hypothetical protein P8M30_20300 [Planctomycetaceae bacterium]|nr:hypothetical protein [Planctomycetaceae bacterium]
MNRKIYLSHSPIAQAIGERTSVIAGRTQLQHESRSHEPAVLAHYGYENARGSPSTPQERLDDECHKLTHHDRSLL